MRLKRKQEPVVSVNVSERMYNPDTKRTAAVPGSSHTITLHNTTVEEVWALIEAAILNAAEDEAEYRQRLDEQQVVRLDNNSDRV